MTFSLSSWQIEFVRPLWFALLAALPLLLIFWRRSLVQVSLGRKVLSLLLRSLLLLLVAAGLAGPKATGPGSHENFDFKWLRSGGGASPPAVEISAPDHVRAGQPFSLDVRLRSKSGGTATAELLCDSQPSQKDTVSLVVGENHKLFRTVAPKPARVVYSVRVKDEQAPGPMRMAAPVPFTWIRRRVCCWSKAKRYWPNISRKPWPVRISRSMSSRNCPILSTSST